MMNPLFNILGGNQNAFSGTPFGNAMNMIQSFNQFRQQFSGDPKQQVQQLLNSGRMSQDQFNQLQQMATQFQNMFRQ